MNPPPPNWPRISTALYCENAREAIDWLCRAFGFTLRLKVEGEGGVLVHTELELAGGVIMVGQMGSPNRPPWRKSPRALGGANTQSMMVYVDDVEAHCAQARAAGAKIVTEPETHDYGPQYWSERGYECEDPDGHHWWFFQRLRNPPA